jgi:APA family basic amino acid/polyamine antiporter
MTVIGALTYADGAMMPHAGGLYVYLREAYGPFPAFLFGWTMFLVIQTGSIAAVAVAFGNFLGVWIPELGTGNVLLRVPYQVPGLEPATLEVSAGQLVAVGVIALLTLLNCRGIHEGKLVQNVFGIAKIGALLVVIVLGFTGSADPRAIAANNADWWGGIYRTDAYLTAATNPWIPPYPRRPLHRRRCAMVGRCSPPTPGAMSLLSPEKCGTRSGTRPRAWSGTRLVIGLYLLVNLATWRRCRCTERQGRRRRSSAASTTPSNSASARPSSSARSRSGEAGSWRRRSWCRSSAVSMASS